MLQETPATTRVPEETRLRILAATRELLARKGRRGTTTREIAERAGVNEATLFRHFGHKDALIEACVSYYCTTVELEELIASLNGDLKGDLRRIGLALAHRMESVRDLILMSLAEENDGPVGSAPWNGPMAIRQLLRDFMAKRVAGRELTGDPLALARFFMGMMFAQVIGRKRFPDYPTAEENIDFQVEMFLHGASSGNR